MNLILANLIRLRILLTYYRIKFFFLASFNLQIIIQILISKIDVFNLNRLINFLIYFSQLIIRARNLFLFSYISFEYYFKTSSRKYIKIRFLTSLFEQCSLQILMRFLNSYTFLQITCFSKITISLSSLVVESK